MKLLELHLLAYGPFTNASLDLCPDGLSIVYGKNEAGKSTALRAISGLLYGIPKNTGDAHLHAMRDLRVGAKVMSAQGEVRKLVRRKGKDHTLLDPEGAPLDEEVMTRLVGGVPAPQFLTMFGLDHETLRRGGEALLLGGGQVGESLFGAAFAGGEVHQVLRALRGEAEALFSARAHTKPLNEAIKAHQEAQKRTREQATSGESFLQQEQALEEAKRERATSDLARQQLASEKGKLERASRALPKAQKRAGAVLRRAALANVVLLDPGAPAARLEQLRILQEAEVELARLEEHVRDLHLRRAALQVSESLVRHRDVPRDLANRLGSHRKAAADLPRVQGELALLESEATALLRSIGRNVTAAASELERARVDAQAQARVRRLAAEWMATERALPDTERELAEREARAAALGRELAELPPPVDTVALKRAVSAAEREGPIEQQLARTAVEVTRLEQQATAVKAALRMNDRRLADVLALAPPSSATIERFAERSAKLDRRREELEARVGEIAGREATIAREIASLELSGQVPTEGDLARARSEREQRWRRLRARILGSSPEPESAGDEARAVEGFELATRDADEVADRLRREADRVSRLAGLVAERISCVALRQAADRERGELEARRASEQAAWAEVWSSASVEPRSPSEMSSWLARHEALCRIGHELQEARGRASALTGAIGEHVERLSSRLEKTRAIAPADSSLRALLDVASTFLERAERTEQDRRMLGQKLADVQAEIARLQVSREEHTSARRAWNAAWAAAVEPLGLPVDTSAPEATLVIDVLGQAFQKLDDAEKARRRADGIERDARGFGRDVDELVAEHAPDLAGLGTVDAAAELIDRYIAGRADLAKRGEVDRQLEGASARVVHERARRDAALAALAALRATARAGSLDELERAERDAAEARRLDAEIADLDAQLVDLGGDAAALAADDADVLASKLADVTAELAEVNERIRVIDGRIGSYSGGLLKMAEPKTDATDAADDAEAALARVRELAERFVKLRVATVVLAREIERYRSTHQGPLLSRASVLFQRLTLGSYAELRTDFDEKDQPVLRGARADGTAIGVEAMSDGTRDQLYLALRLATLERQADIAETLPVVLDDVLIHFDDDRARAALSVIAETAKKTQIIFFTHHARLVDLAREILPARDLHLCELEGRGARVLGAQARLI